MSKKKPLPLPTGPLPIAPHKSDRKPNPFKLGIFTKCCGEYPRYTKESNQWWAICPVCKWAVASQTYDPQELAPAWNATFNK